MSKPTRYMRRSDRDRIHHQTGKLCDAAEMVRRAKREAGRAEAMADSLAKALERIRGCYWSTLSGKSVRDADETFAKTDTALESYRKARGE